MTQIKNSFRSSLGSYGLLMIFLLGKYPRHGKHIFRKGIFLHHMPVSMNVICIFQVYSTHMGNGTLHGIKRIGLARQNTVFDDLMKLLRKFGTLVYSKEPGTIE